MTASFTMTVEERETFLADVHVAVVSFNRADRGPLVMPIWYVYEPGGELWFTTGAASRKSGDLGPGQRLSLCAQVEAFPSRYVSVEGPIASVRAASDDDLRRLARRYLGRVRGDWYTADTEGRAEALRVAMTPERWHTVDYSKG